MCRYLRLLLSLSVDNVIAVLFPYQGDSYVAGSCLLQRRQIPATGVMRPCVATGRSPSSRGDPPKGIELLRVRRRKTGMPLPHLGRRAPAFRNPFRWDPEPVPFVPRPEVALLPAATPQVVVVKAPKDVRTRQSTRGIAVRANLASAPVFDAPGGDAVAHLPTHYLGYELWVPVIDRRPGWVHVLLPSAPAGSTGWLAESRVSAVRGRQELRVYLKTASLRIIEARRVVATWPLSSTAPLRSGRTFLLAARKDPRATGVPPFLALGIGGEHPGSHGRDVGISIGGENAEPLSVPAEAATSLSAVRPGTLVRIYR